MPDNIVNSGQAIPVTGSGHTLGFLGASNNGTGSGTGTVVYGDGTTQTFALGFADWWAGSMVLPHLTDNGQTAGITALHVFALGFGT